MSNLHFASLPLLLLLLLFHGGSSMHCTWDMSITAAEAQRINCGFRCPDPWGKDEPHGCGPPFVCCCAPKCNNAAAKKTAFLGVNWNDKYSRRPLARSHQFQILKDTGIDHLKVFSPDGLADIRRVYGKGNAHLYVGIPNRDLADLAANYEAALIYCKKQLLPYAEEIKVVIVGNEPLICIKTAKWEENGECGSLSPPSRLLPAMKNVRQALEELGMARPVSTAFNGGILEMSTNPWTPCVSDFKAHIKPILIPVWEFLRKHNAPFIVNIYSWFATLSGALTPTYATGLEGPVSMDGRYGYYFNFDMQLEMQRVAMCKNNIGDLDLWVGETGWPTGGHAKATLANAREYAKNVVIRAQGGGLYNATLDTMRFKGMPYTLFLFEGFNEEKKFEIEHGNKYENHFGLFYEDGTPKWRDRNGMLDLPIPGKKNKVETPPEDGPSIYRSMSRRQETSCCVYSFVVLLVIIKSTKW